MGGCADGAERGGVRMGPLRIRMVFHASAAWPWRARARPMRHAMKIGETRRITPSR